MWRQNLLPPMPPELKGQDVKVEFVSLLAQAQKMVSTGSVDRLMNFVKTISPLQPDIADTIDADKAVDEYADYLGIAPAILRPQKERDQLRKERKEAEAALKQAELEKETQAQGVKNLQEMAKAAETLSKADISENSLLGVMAKPVQNVLVNSFGGT